MYNSPPKALATPPAQTSDTQVTEKQMWKMCVCGQCMCNTKKTCAHNEKIKYTKTLHKKEHTKESQKVTSSTAGDGSWSGTAESVDVQHV